MATDFLVKQGRVMGGVRLVTDADVAHQTDLTNIRETGTTASQAISAGTYFYLNGTLVRAKVDIANGATFTLNTNYEVVTAGGLNELNDAISTLVTTRLASKSGFSVTANTPLEVGIDIPSVPGYKCIGALTFQTYVQSNSTEYVSRVNFNSLGTQIVMKFVSSASRTDGNASVNITLLYIKEFT